MENVEAIFMIDNLFASYLENVSGCSLMNMKDSFDFFFIPVQFFFFRICAFLNLLGLSTYCNSIHPI